MLLQHRLNEISSVIAGYQSQIDELNAKISALQAHAQKVGSVEAAMESAVSQLQVAISMIHQVCPDELVEFKEVINSQFGESPIAELPSSDEPTEAVEPTEPTAPTNSPENNTEPPTIDVEAESTEQLKNPSFLIMKGEVDKKPEWHSLKWQDFVKCAKSKGINVKGKTRSEIELELLNLQ